MKRKLTAAVLLLCMAVSLIVPVRAEEHILGTDCMNPEEGIAAVTAAATNQDIIWAYLKANGLSDEGAAGVMGNLEAESMYLPNNLQNTY